MNDDLIFLRDHPSKPLTPLSYNSLGDDAENVLQELLERHSELLAGRDMNPGSPRRFVLVKRETPVPDRLNGGGRWSIDHLFLDQDAVPTLVEVKRSSDTRIRREVVGQMLDYAANGIRYWADGQMRAMFAQTSHSRQVAESDQLNDPDIEIRALLGEEEETTEVDEFWQKAETNLRDGRIRLIFVADVIPEELRAIIEFLNERMAKVDVFGVEVRRYTHSDGYECFVPRLIGATAVAAAQKGRRPPVPLEVFLENCEDSVRSEVEKVLQDWSGDSSPMATATENYLALFMRNPLKGGGDTNVVSLGPNGEVWINRGYILAAGRAGELPSRIEEWGPDRVAQLDQLIERTFPGIRRGTKNYLLRAPTISAEAVLHFAQQLAQWFSGVSGQKGNAG